MQDTRSVAEIREALATASDRRLAALLAQLSDDRRAGVVAACGVARRRLEAQRAERTRLRALYEIEDRLRESGTLVAAGVDEVGRGALAGPLTVAAVVLPPEPRIPGLDDSKRLTRSQREDVADSIREHSVAFCIAHVEAPDLDRLGMTAALRRAMTEAIAGLGLDVGHALIDGLPMRVHRNETAVVKGDSKVAAIAAASVVAKVTRDSLMRSFAPEYPAYGFELHKGYSTAEHMQAIEEHGLTPLHRRSFAPCAGTPRLF